jgi:hypothetical protein
MIMLTGLPVLLEDTFLKRTKSIGRRNDHAFREYVGSLESSRRMPTLVCPAPGSSSDHHV